MRTIAEASRPRDLVQHLRDTTRLAVLLDYDGTLVPFAALPRQATPDDDLRRLLAALAVRPRTRVEIVSGRDPATLETWFGDLPIALRAEHGAWTRDTGGNGMWVASVPVQKRTVTTAAERLSEITRRLGGWIEHKMTGAAWHHRDVAVSDTAVEEVVSEAKRQLLDLGFDVIHGNCVVEARARGAHKGRAVHEALSRTPGSTVVAIGDDTTDEDMFHALPEGKVGILVGSAQRATAAAHRLEHPRDVRAFLSALVASD
ncbi:MAG TPA: trehalose-phosphatase [Labilithrix sp.]|nr:trehalose-phosphatase [Labilithrix sp.]